MKKHNFWLLLIVLLFLPFGKLILDSCVNWTSANWKDLAMGDFIDQGPIVRGLVETRTLNQTAQWWTGDWVSYGPNGDSYQGFYRPLTSLVWWAMTRIFGFDSGGVLAFQTTLYLTHFVVCLLFAALVRRIAGDRIALFSALIWMLGAVDLLKLPIAFWALRLWKDLPDLWVAACLLLGIHALLWFLKTGHRRFVAGLFAAQIAGIAFKEAAYVLPFLAAALVWFVGTRKRAGWGVVAGTFGVTLAAYAFRWWALQGPGFRFGTNGSWFERFLLHVGGGRAVNWAWEGDSAALGLAFVGFALLWAWSHNRRHALVALGLGAFFIMRSDFYAGEFGATLWRLMTPIYGTFVQSGFVLHIDALGALFIGSSAYSAWLRRDRLMGLAALWTVGAYTPLLTAPITDHGLYLCSAGWAFWWGATMIALLRWFRDGAGVFDQKRRHF